MAEITPETQEAAQKIYGTYRDELSTVSEDGKKRKWMYPRKQGGFFHNMRAFVAAILLGMFVLLPFIEVNGRPLFMFNFFDRKFIIFGNLFWPQDLHLFLFAFLAFIVFIILFTAVYGRVWCGWACPQTVFMEMVFRKLEYLIEGDVTKQKKLNEGPWNSDKITRKTVKHIVFFLVALLVTHILMAHLIGVEGVKKLFTSNPKENWAGFVGMLSFSILFYSIFAFLRELACIIICPYGRLQSVLINKETLVVAYDHVRGEPRGRINKANPDLSLGDCIDCKKCVQVCPTGIDIRNGLQLECVNCTLCMDACDEVMAKVDRPKGLIRLASENNIERGEKFKFGARAAGYTIVLVALLGMFGFLFSKRAPVEATVLRVPGKLYHVKKDGTVSNLYNVQLINKTDQTMRLKLKVDNPNARIQVVGDSLVIPKEKLEDVVFIIEMDGEAIKEMRQQLNFEFININNGEVVDKAGASFIGPVAK